MPTEIVEQLEAQVVAMQFSLCSKQKQMQDYFKSSPREPTPSKNQGHVHPQKKQGHLHPSKMFPLRQLQMLQKMFPL